MAQAFQSIVIQIDVGLNDLGVLQRIGIDSKVVVVGRNLDPTGLHLLYRMVPAMVAKSEFVSLASEGEADQLVSQADAKDRRLPH